MLCPKKYGKNIPTMDKEEILQIPIILQIHIQPLLRTYLLVDLENIYSMIFKQSTSDTGDRLERKSNRLVHGG